MKINIIGCGLAGVTSAILLKEQGHDVEIFEMRDHIAGNCFDKKQEGVTVHGKNLKLTLDHTFFILQIKKCGIS